MSEENPGGIAIIFALIVGCIIKLFSCCC